jgi:hypothetical protein
MSHLRSPRRAAVAITEEDAMSGTCIIEEESGTFHERRHRHDGYYAGDFSDVPFQSLAMNTGWSTTRRQGSVIYAIGLGPRHRETWRLT